MHSGGLVKKRVPAHERVEPFLAEELAERLHLRRRAVERRQRLHRLAILDELDDAEEADRADVADARMLRLQLLEHLRITTPIVFARSISLSSS